MIHICILTILEAKSRMLLRSAISSESDAGAFSIESGLALQFSDETYC